MRKTAKDVMTKNVIMVEEDLVIDNLIGLFQKKNISAAPVIDKKKKLVGIVTKTDIIGTYIDAHIDLNLKFGLKDILGDTQEESSIEILSCTDLRAKDIMVSDPITVSENTTIKKMAEIMVDNRIHRLIVMRKNTIVGIVSTLDMLYYISGREKSE